MDDAGTLMPEVVLSTPQPGSAGVDMLRPSEYTAMLLHALSLRADRIRGAHVLEVGVGSGVILAGAASLGAARLTGVDIEPLAVQRATAMLAGLPKVPPYQVVQADMWAPFAGQCFDVILANLPHFPAAHVSQPTRLNTWSNGGVDGRLLLEKFLGGLSTHLAPDGLVLLVHSAFTDLNRSRIQLARWGLSMQPLSTSLIQVELGKLKALSPSIRARFLGAELKQFGAYAFSLTHVMEIAHLGKPGAGTGSAPTP